MKCLLYPSAGSDWLPILKQFFDKVDQFIFADLHYSQRDIRCFKTDLQEKYMITSIDIDGSFDSKPKAVNDMIGNAYHTIQPSYATFTLNVDDQSKRVIFRKGYGQYALREVENGTLHYFCHRGDSPAEGGSGVFYLGNRNARHKEIARLWDQLVKKLAVDSFIVSDGSNTSFKILRQLYEKIKDLDINKANDEVLNQSVNIKGTKLTCVNVLDYRYNHTLMWKVEKKL